MIATFKSDRLEDVIPQRFGDWRIDTSIVPVLPDPSLLASVNRIYSDTLARTYVNSHGQRIMLSLAYGQRQDDTMRLHRPEGCYTGQGFGVRGLGVASVELAGRPMEVVRLFAHKDLRDEPVTYWMVVGGTHAITQLEAKLAQLGFGLRGYLSDGLLFRVSSLGRDPDIAFALQDGFVRALLSDLPPDVQAGLVGR